MAEFAVNDDPSHQRSRFLVLLRPHLAVEAAIDVGKEHPLVRPALKPTVLFQQLQRHVPELVLRLNLRLAPGAVDLDSVSLISLDHDLDFLMAHVDTGGRLHYHDG